MNDTVHHLQWQEGDTTRHTFTFSATGVDMLRRFCDNQEIPHSYQRLSLDRAVKDFYIYFQLEWLDSRGALHIEWWRNFQRAKHRLWELMEQDLVPDFSPMHPQDVQPSLVMDLH